MTMPDFLLEEKFSGLVAGVDEAGRGPWAGPVVAGAVIIKDRNLGDFLLNGLDDSKKLTPHKRDQLYEAVREAEKAGKLLVGLGEASAEEIDAMNILQATFLAMRRAVDALGIVPEHALVDGNQKPRDFPCAVTTVVKGDSRSMSIAAASIMAKVSRDCFMTELAKKYPYYGFETNAGYGTKTHIEGLKIHGITPFHRKSYRPVREFLQDKTA